MLRFRSSTLAALACLSLAAAAPAQELEPSAGEFFETRIRPVLSRHCYECHNSQGRAEGGLIKDLKSRGLLDETLVIWAGEFGRTPFHQGTNGRDHNPYGLSIWLAGGGAKRGSIYGRTDDYGYHVVENKATVYDLWATVLHLLGIDHHALTFRHAGRDFRLTDVHGNVLHDVVA